MELKMSAEEVLTTIRNLRGNGEVLNKKKVKQSHPDLMRSALFYFPSWEHAIQNAESLT
ncbi:hypothetical protein [Ammoniphilus sp. 3BR4]|uniref:hypothetical protein n=1 Tax=Ammoniphilus sp. 3BR4 TaxID=3158265 RepID=UPI003466F67C